MENVISNNVKKETRLSGVELLKIIAILLIVLSHCSASMCNSGFSNSFLITCTWLGQIGNIIFLTSSSYFLLKSNKCKGDKALNIILDSMFISITIYLVYVACGKVAFDTHYFMKQIFPDLFLNVWFIPFYVLLYLTN